MKQSSNLRTKLFLGFGFTILTFILASLITLFFVLHVKRFNQHLILVDVPTYDHFTDLATAVDQSYIAFQNWNLQKDEKYVRIVNDSAVAINRSSVEIDSLEPQWKNNLMSEKWHEIKNQLVQLHTLETNVFNTNTSSVIDNQINSVFESLRNNLNIIGASGNTTTRGIIDMQLDLIKTFSNNIISNMHLLIVIEILSIVFVTLIAFLISFYTGHSILGHINKLRLHSNRVAKGDLQHQIKVDSSDEIGQLGEDLNLMSRNLADITKEVIESGHTMASMLEEVKSAMNSQASGATEQAASVNEITASLTEIEKSSQQTMEKAKTLGSLAENSRQQGKIGLDSIELSIKGMKAIREKVELIAQTILDLSKQTQQVGDITTAVNDFALQSKMLALNASIEAVKAGESGKGFAVVASEIKNLAEQSEESTSQVQKILENIRHATEKAVMVTEEGTKGVDEGKDLVERTGEVINSLNKAINEAGIACQQIEAAVRQEAAGIEQITAGMNEINQVTTSFVNNVEQTNEAMENLSKVTKNLKSQIEFYKI